MKQLLTLRQRVEWRDGKDLRKGTVSTIWNQGADAIVHADNGEILHVTAQRAGIPTPALEVAVDLGEAKALALQILSRKPPPGSVTKQMLLLAAAVVKLGLPAPEVPT